MVTLSESSREAIQILCSVIGSTIANALPPPQWPFLIFEGDAYLNKYYWGHLYETLFMMEKLGCTEEEIANGFPRASRIVHLLASMYGLPLSNLSTKQRAELVSKLLGYIRLFRKKDPFCANGRNTLWEKDEVNRALSVIHRLDDDPDQGIYRQLIGKINGSLFALCDVLHAGIHFAGHEFHGAYALAGKKTLVVREYFDLRPIEIWDFTQGLEYETICTIEVYKGIDITFDFFNHIRSSSSVPQHLMGIFVGTKCLETAIQGVDALREMAENIVKTLTHAAQETSDYTKKDWIRKYVEMHYYYLKWHRDRLGLDWRPSKEQYDLLETEPEEEVARSFAGLRGKSKDEIAVIIADLYRKAILGDEFV